MYRIRAKGLRKFCHQTLIVLSKSTKPKFLKKECFSTGENFLSHRTKSLRSWRLFCFEFTENLFIYEFHSTRTTNLPCQSDMTVCKILAIIFYDDARKKIRYVVLYCAGRASVLGGNTSEFGLNSGRGRSFIEPCDAKARMPKSSGIGRNVRTLLGLSLSLAPFSLSLFLSL